MSRWQEQCEERSGEEHPHSTFKDSWISCQRGDIRRGGGEGRVGGGRWEEEKAEWEVGGGRWEGGEGRGEGCPKSETSPLPTQAG